MKNSILLIIAVSILFSYSSKAQTVRGPSVASLRTKPQEADARLGWWREARFGMFVHWGVPSDLGGTWKGVKYGGYGEHIQRKAKIPIPVYKSDVVAPFNPTKFITTIQEAINCCRVLIGGKKTLLLSKRHKNMLMKNQFLRF
jgi:hypothetical protein